MPRNLEAIIGKTKYLSPIYKELSSLCPIHIALVS